MPKHYPDLPAARHMGPLASSEARPSAAADRGPVRPARDRPAPAGVRREPAEKYRRQRVAATAVVILMTLALAGLITALVLFG
ncbi:hypothetical protein BN1051_01796 [Arthrobacter saudimassiliensis]|uniref:Uncharacterized protein n=1 Tax=Arthrobacter saudimassiliensis TaxID=1461584 RepID=A0A078MMC6_9MICC|nr:hypothetical protein BN1051_01796 [Arthrobacter saudimassiliensis]